MGAVSKVFRGLSGISLIIYFLAWVLAVIGLGTAQNWCNDREVASRAFTSQQIGGNFSAYVGGDCAKLLRFPWTVWALSSLPLLFAMVQIVKPSLLPRGSIGLFGVLAALQILMANDFYNAADVANERTNGDSLVSWGNMKDWTQIALAGFAGLAAASLLTIICEAATDPHDGKHTHTTGGSYRQKEAAPAVGGEAPRRDASFESAHSPRSEASRGERQQPVARIPAEQVPVVTERPGQPVPVVMPVRRD